MSLNYTYRKENSNVITNINIITNTITTITNPNVIQLYYPLLTQSSTRKLIIFFHSVKSNKTLVFHILKNQSLHLNKQLKVPICKCHTYIYISYCLKSRYVHLFIIFAISNMRVNIPRNVKFLTVTDVSLFHERVFKYVCIYFSHITTRVHILKFCVPK